MAIAEETAPSGEAARPPRMRRIARIGSPITLALALVLFALPFLSVSCDAPGGYGRMNAGGTTTYTGLDLAFGTAPSVDADHLRNSTQQQSDDLGVQLLVALAAVAIFAAIVLTRFSGRHRMAPALAAIVGAMSLVIGLLVARASLVDRVAEQATVVFPPGKSAGDYVKVGIGFWLVTILTLIGAGLSAFGARAPDRSAPG